MIANNFVHAYSLLAGQSQQNSASTAQGQQQTVANPAPVFPHQPFNVSSSTTSGSSTVTSKTVPIQPEISEPVDTNGGVRQHVPLRHTTSGTRERSISTPNVLYNHTQSREREGNSSEVHVSIHLY